MRFVLPPGEDGWQAFVSPSGRYIAFGEQSAQILNLGQRDTIIHVFPPAVMSRPVGWVDDTHLVVRQDGRLGLTWVYDVVQRQATTALPTLPVETRQDTTVAVSGDWICTVIEFPIPMVSVSRHFVSQMSIVRTVPEGVVGCDFQVVPASQLAIVATWSSTGQLVVQDIYLGQPWSLVVPSETRP